MEVKAELNKPYSDEQRMNFIVEYNHNLGYEIKETPEALQAWDYDEAEKQQQERERLNNLNMRRGDVFEALILAKGITEDEIIKMVENAEIDLVTKALYLNRLKNAIDFYRGYPIFDLLGESQNITPEMWDKFFDTKDYNCLIAEN